ncbi:MAG: DUF3078 domain-containing protein, partial [Chitinophagales bacterium]|nr:DUF3078 domain-containing protein [Chitinophagales bacterium]
YLTLLLLFCIYNINADDLDFVFKDIAISDSQAKTKDDAKKITENPDGWKIGGTASLTFNQVGLKNWSAGGDPSISLLGVVNGYADYKFKKHLWQNRLGIEYGTQKLKSQPIRKNSDRFEIFSKYGYAISKKWYVSVYANIRTLMTPTYEYNAAGDKVLMISKFASPMVIDGAIGMDYVPNQYFSMFLSPLASKMIIVANDSISAQDRYGANGKKFRWELGATAILSYKQEVVKNVNIQSVLRLFRDYRNGPAQNIDVDWQNTVGLKVNKFLSAAVFTHLIWDYDQLIPQFEDNVQVGTARKLQFRNVIGIGLSYNIDKVFKKEVPTEK